MPLIASFRLLCCKCEGTFIAFSFGEEEFNCALSADESKGHCEVGSPGGGYLNALDGQLRLYGSACT